MISLSAPTYDPAGSLIIKASISNPYVGKRRGNVTATLDGESYSYDAGYSDSDITLTARLSKPGKEIVQTLQYLVAYYSKCILAYERGCFYVIPSFEVSGAELRLEFRILERLDV